MPDRQRTSVPPSQKDTAHKAERAAPQAPEQAPEQAPAMPVVRRSFADPRTLSPENLLALQRTIGNRAVQRLLQRKLMVGAAHDPYEQQADRVADQVMRSPAPAAPVQR